MSELISKKRISKATPREPNRTRWLYTVKCSECGKLIERLNDPKLDKNCKSCETKNARLQNFIKKVETKFTHIKVEDTTNFNSLESIVTLRCIKHNYNFNIKARYAINKSVSTRTGNCPLCVKELRHTDPLHTVKYYEDIITEISNGNVQLLHTLDKDTKVKGDQDVLGNCKIHGKFPITFREAIKNIKACPSCGRSSNSVANRTYDIKNSGNVYFIKLQLNDTLLYKVGVAKNVQARLNKIYSEIPIEVLWVYETNTLQLAYLLEHILLVKYTNLRITDLKLTKHSTEFLHSFINKPTKGFVEEILRLTEPKRGNP